MLLGHWDYDVATAVISSYPLLLGPAIARRAARSLRAAGPGRWAGVRTGDRHRIRSSPQLSVEQAACGYLYKTSCTSGWVRVESR
jgi:hypothetical protein